MTYDIWCLPLYVEDIKTQKYIELLGTVAHTCDISTLETIAEESSLKGRLWVPKTPPAKTKQAKNEIKEWQLRNMVDLGGSFVCLLHDWAGWEL